MRGLLTPWPVDEPADWARWVDAPQTSAEVAALREHIRRGRPYGDRTWTTATAAKLHLESTLHPRGRPRGEQRT